MMDMEDDLDFTDDEIREELSKLGYSHVPDNRLYEFKKDLKVLMQREYSKNSSQNTSFSSNAHQDTTTSVEGRQTTRHDRCPLEEKTDYGPYVNSKHKFVSQQDGKENRFDVGSVPQLKKSLPPGQVRGHFAMYDSTPDISQSHLRDDISETDSERKLVKRKILRKRDDGSKVVDESVTESDIDSILDLHERLRDLGIDDHGYNSARRPMSAQSAPPYRLAADDPRPASVILRPTQHPHTKNLRKSDPVARFQQFKQSWSQQRAPGEKSHKSLRWNVREQMLSQDQVIEKKTPRVYVPNGYVVPTDKKRKNLRWQIRTDIAHGHMPQHGFYHEY